MRNDELAHYGILGMKWGIRRFQNPDGTLTPEGKIRYGSKESQDRMASELKKGRLPPEIRSALITTLGARRKYIAAKKKLVKYQDKAVSTYEKAQDIALRYCKKFNIDPNSEDYSWISEEVWVKPTRFLTAIDKTASKLYDAIGDAQIEYYKQIANVVKQYAGNDFSKNEWARIVQDGAGYLNEQSEIWSTPSLAGVITGKNKIYNKSDINDSSTDQYIAYWDPRKFDLFSKM